MSSADATIALGAGMLAALNPCGFALLPAYLTLLVTGDQPNRVVAVARALKMTVAMTAGFTSVFAAFGLLIAPTAGSVQRYLPWFSLFVGLAIMVAGLWLLAGRRIAIPRRGSRSNVPITRSWRSMAGFGVSYALASLTCTIAPFLAVVVSVFRTDSQLSGSALFLIYATGMGLVVGTAALAVALAQQSLLRGARRLGRLVPMAGATVLLLVGAYVAYYGWWEIRVLDGASADDPVIETASTIQHWLANAVSDIGASAFALAFAAMLLAVGAAEVRRRNQPAEHAKSPSAETPAPTTEP